MTTKQRHPNAEMIMQVAQWVAEGETEFEFLVPEHRGGPWYSCCHDDTTGSSAFIHACDGREIRLKPEPRKTIRIGEYDVPEPLREMPKKGDRYFFTQLDCGVYSYKWVDDDIDLNIFKNHRCFATKEDAELASKAITALFAPKDGT